MTSGLLFHDQFPVFMQTACIHVVKIDPGPDSPGCPRTKIQVKCIGSLPEMAKVRMPDEFAEKVKDFHLNRRRLRKVDLKTEQSISGIRIYQDLFILKLPRV